jgi:hypothetical protein
MVLVALPVTPLLPVLMYRAGGDGRGAFGTARYIVRFCPLFQMTLSISRYISLVYPTERFPARTY